MPLPGRVLSEKHGKEDSYEKRMKSKADPKFPLKVKRLPNGKRELIDHFKVAGLDTLDYRKRHCRIRIRKAELTSKPRSASIKEFMKMACDQRTGAL